MLYPVSICNDINSITPLQFRRTTDFSRKKMTRKKREKKQLVELRKNLNKLWLRMSEP